MYTRRVYEMASLNTKPDEVPSDAWALYTAALQEEKSGHLSEAKEKYEKAVEIFPRFEIAWLNLAMVYQDLGDSTKPIEISKEALKHVPHSSNLWSNLGTFYAKNKMHFMAKEALQKAVEFDPFNYSAALNLSTLLRLLKEFQEAEKVICAILDKPVDESLYPRIKGTISELWAQLGLVRGQMGKNEEVRSACEKALEIDSTNRTANELLTRVQDWEKVNKLYELGVELYDQQEYSRAIEVYNEVLSINPSHMYARINIASALVNLKQYEEAEKRLRSILEEDDSSHIMWINLGKALVGLDNDEEAETAFKRCLEIQPDYANAWYQLACVYDRQDRLSDSEDALRKTVEHNPDHYRAWSDLGVTLLQLGRNSEAEGPLRKATQYGPDDIKSWVNLGLYYTTQNRCEDAKEAMEAARRIDPDDRHLRQLIAMWNQSCA